VNKGNLSIVEHDSANVQLIYTFLTCELLINS